MKRKLKMLLTTQNAKTSKGESLGYLTGILYLAPSKSVDGINTCPMASKGCSQSCLFTAGRGKFKSVKQTRINKTIIFRDDLGYFMESIVYSIQKTIKQAKKLGLKPCIRLNGTSDIQWEKIRNKEGKNILEIFPDIQFYDYTADHTRHKAFLGTWQNYHLTFSRKESKANNRQAERLLSMGVNVSAVYLDLDKALTAFDAINGDIHDLRFLDGKQGKIVALRAKGEAKKDFSGFVIRNA